MGRAWKKKIAWTLGGLVIFLLIVVATLPFWFFWVLGGVLAREGVTFSGVERQGYGRFLVKGVHFSKKGTTFEAKEVSCWFPTKLVWRRVFGTNQSSQPDRPVVVEAVQRQGTVAFQCDPNLLGTVGLPLGYV